MLQIRVEGVYESDTGSGQKKYQNFNLNFEISREREQGIETHVLRRFIPYIISENNKKNNKNNIPFSRIKSFVITEIKKIDKKSPLIGKDIKELDAWEIQDLACLFDLYKVPLHGKFSITELKNRAILAYMEKVLKVPMKTPEEKAQQEFFKKMPDGTFKVDLNNTPCPVIIPDGYFEEKEESKKSKKSLSYYIQQAGQKVANVVLNATGNQDLTQTNESPTGNKEKFPSANELQQ